MNYWVSHYSIKYNIKNRLVENPGFFLRLQNDDFESGYAACHIWENLGDKPVEAQIQSLRENKPSDLVKSCLGFATEDGRARAEKKSLLAGLDPCLNHKTILSLNDLTEDSLNEIASLGFTKLKLKVDGSSSSDLNKVLNMSLPARLKLRLDFNTSGAERFLAQASANLIDQIEFIEDPCPYDEKTWQDMHAKYAVDLAFDQPGSDYENNPFCQFRVYKPAKNFDVCNIKGERKVFTHYLDSDFGQRCAFWKASKIGPQETEWGFLPQGWIKGPRYVPNVDGYGFGMDDFFKNLKWEKL